MAKAKRPAPQPGAWNWLAAWTRVHGIDWNTTSIPQTAALLIRKLEAFERNGQPLPTDIVRLAALLVKIEGEMLIAQATVANPFLERATLGSAPGHWSGNSASVLCCATSR